MNEEDKPLYEDYIFPNPKNYGLQFQGFGYTKKKTHIEPNLEKNSSVKEPQSHASFKELRKKLDISFQANHDSSDHKLETVEAKEIEHSLGFNFVETWNDYFNQVEDSFTLHNQVLKSLSNQDNYKGGKVSVLFLGDTYLPNQHCDEGDMLSKMIQAMKLSPDEYCRLFYDPSFPEEKYFHAFFQEISLFQPSYVVCMGATITNLFLRKQNRLTKVHGKFYPIKITDQNSTSISFQAVPIFHPEYLKVNTSMKKNTWEDLQKLMKELGKC